jgi:hypothetical protein
VANEKRIADLLSDEFMVDRLYFSRHLDSNGDGTGTISFAFDADATPTTMAIIPVAGQRLHISRLLVSMEDATVQAANYGAIAGGLTNGIPLTWKTRGREVDLLDGDNIKRNGDLAAHCFDVDRITWGAGDDLLKVRWTFTKGGAYLTLDGDQGDGLFSYLSDDLSDLSKHEFIVQGWQE